MPKSLINGLTPEPLFYADVFSLVTQGRFAFDDQDWADALPSGNRASSITISTEYTYQIHNQPDFAMEAGLTFYGKFRKVDGDWTGKITQVEFERDGMVVGDIQIRSGVDFSRVQDVKPVGLIWNELTVTGLKGSLTSAQDYINGSLGDDIIFAGGGHDYINASRGNDRIFGQAGNDMIDGFDGDDYINGGGGADQLYGKGGSDTILGGGGRDKFYADFTGTNVWTGGKGGDFFQAGGYHWSGVAVTRVTDFNRSERDKLDLREQSELLFNSVDEVRYIGKRAFSYDADVLEIQMRDGLVKLNTGDGQFIEYALQLDGLTTFKASQTNWIALPDGWDFS
ncbi:MAG: hypothetical protein CML02_05205 [Pseudooceanicola sp.]|jgi:Ca2+-binding RTX toxin-like protein|nr:hypothetical protein [Pseudooceanicola sp.]